MEIVPRHRARLKFIRVFTRGQRLTTKASINSRNTKLSLETRERTLQDTRTKHRGYFIKFIRDLKRTLPRWIRGFQGVWIIDTACAPVLRTKYEVSRGNEISRRFWRRFCIPVRNEFNATWMFYIPPRVTLQHLSCNCTTVYDAFNRSGAWKTFGISNGKAFQFDRERNNVSGMSMLTFRYPNAKAFESHRKENNRINNYLRTE